MSMGGKIKWFGGAEKKEKSKPAAAIAPVGSGTALKPTSEVADVPKQGKVERCSRELPGHHREAIVKRIRDLLTAAPPFYPTTNASGDQTSKLMDGDRSTRYKAPSSSLCSPILPL
jgi:hypothetical protein